MHVTAENDSTRTKVAYASPESFPIWSEISKNVRYNTKHGKDVKSRIGKDMSTYSAQLNQASSYLDMQQSCISLEK